MHRRMARAIGDMRAPGRIQDGEISARFVAEARPWWLFSGSGTHVFAAETRGWPSRRGSATTRGFRRRGAPPHTCEPKPSHVCRVSSSFDHSARRLRGDDRRHPVATFGGGRFGARHRWWRRWPHDGTWHGQRAHAHDCCSCDDLHRDVDCACTRRKGVAFGWSADTRHRWPADHAAGLAHGARSALADSATGESAGDSGSGSTSLSRTGRWTTRARDTACTA